jgi:hypothetical protein
MTSFDERYKKLTLQISPSDPIYLFSSIETIPFAKIEVNENSPHKKCKLNFWMPEIVTALRHRVMQHERYKDYQQIWTANDAFIRDKGD